MSDYIKREDAHKILCQFCTGAAICIHEGVCNAEKALSNIPAADVVERKVGRWEGGDYPYMTEITPLGRNEHYWYSCSICKCGQGYKTPYCPNCGADMRSLTYTLSMENGTFSFRNTKGGET